MGTVTAISPVVAELFEARRSEGRRVRILPPPLLLPLFWVDVDPYIGKEGILFHEGLDQYRRNVVYTIFLKINGIPVYKDYHYRERLEFFPEQSDEREGNE